LHTNRREFAHPNRPTPLGKVAGCFEESIQSATSPNRSGRDETEPMVGAVERGHESFGRQAWGAAWSQLSAAEHEVPLELDDLERLAVAAFLVGRDEESVDVWARAHHVCIRIGDVARTARCAFWSAFVLLNKGQLARGGGWIHRAQRLLDERDLDCVEQGVPALCRLPPPGVRGRSSGRPDGFR
jgi:hypothetical protein